MGKKNLLCRGCKDIPDKLAEFCTWTSCGGIPLIGSAPTKVWRYFWVVITLISAGLLIYFLVNIFLKYFSFPMDTSLQLKFERVNFPSVTACSLSPFNIDKLEGRNQAYTAGNVGEMKLEHIIAHNEMARKAGYGTAAGTQEQENLQKYGIVYNTTADREVDVMRVVKTWNQYLMYNMESGGNFSDFAFDVDDIVMQCTYNVKACSTIHFTQTFHPAYGYCFTFNPEGKYVVERSGSVYGLQLLLKADHDVYPSTSPTTGFRVAIHPAGSEPFLRSKGYNAAPGFTTGFGYRYLRTDRLSPPFGDCDNQTDQYTHYYQGNYSVDGCLKSCMQDAIVTKCGCFDPNLAQPSAGGTSCSSPAADIAVVRDRMKCVFEVHETFNALDSCTCPPPCIHIAFEASTTTTRWPAENYIPVECYNNTLKHNHWQHNATEYQTTWIEGTYTLPSGPFVPASDTKFYDAATAPVTDTEKCQEWYNHNTLRIEVFQERMNYHVVGQSGAYGIVQMICDIGGQLGLFIGCSFICLIEFISLIVFITCGVRCLLVNNPNRFKPKPKPPTPSPTPEPTPPPTPPPPPPPKPKKKKPKPPSPEPDSEPEGPFRSRGARVRPAPIPGDSAPVPSPSPPPSPELEKPDDYSPFRPRGPEGEGELAPESPKQRSPTPPPSPTMEKPDDYSPFRPRGPENERPKSKRKKKPKREPSRLYDNSDNEGIPPSPV